MSLHSSQTETEVRGTADVTIEGKTVRLTTGWTDRFHFQQSYGVLDQLKDRAKGIVYDYEKLWGPTAARIEYREQTRTTTVQTYRSIQSKVRATEKAGAA